MKLEVDLYIVSTPYHILMACNRCKSEDILILFGKDKLSKFLENMLLHFFYDHWIQAMSLDDYKKNKIEFLIFKRNMHILQKQIKGFSKQIRNIIVFNDVDPETQWLLNRITHVGEIILIEEGIGLYRKIHKKNDILFRIFGKLFFGWEFVNVEQIGELKKIDKIICRFPDKLTEVQKRKKIELQEEKCFDRVRENMNINYLEGQNWFIGQPVVEDGVMSIERFMKIIFRLSNMKKSLIVKPHPRENLEKYSRIENIEIIHDNTIPIELLLDNCQDYRFYTLYSSAIIQAANYGKAGALYKLAQIDLPFEIESVFEQSDVKIMNTWSEVEKL